MTTPRSSSTSTNSTSATATTTTSSSSSSSSSSTALAMPDLPLPPPPANELQDDWTPDAQGTLNGEKLVMKIDGVLFLTHFRRVDYSTRGEFVMTNYRVFFTPDERAKYVAGWDATSSQVPVSTIARIKVEEIKQGGKKAKSSDRPPMGILTLSCKDARTLKYAFTDIATCKRAQMCLEQFVYTEKPEYLFAFYYKLTTPPAPRDDGWLFTDLKTEYARMGIPNERWRLSHVNHDFKMCASYPQLFAVPTMALVTDTNLLAIAQFRSRGRIPILCWKHPNSNVALFRCSQPKVGLQNNRCEEDEKYFAAIGELNAQPDVTVTGAGKAAKMFGMHTKQKQKTKIGNGNDDDDEEAAAKRSAADAAAADAAAVAGHDTPSLVNTAMAASDAQRDRAQRHAERNRRGGSKQVIIYDARPKKNAIANRFGGKGFENPLHYHNSEILFMNIGNIHVMRNSLESLLKTLHRGIEHDATLYKGVHSSDWLQHISIVLKATFDMVRDLDINHKSIVCHCSDGWDRTSQLCALTELCMDPHYRTTRGFCTLVDKEWLSFGHKFDQRCGHGDKNIDDTQRSPIFLQFCDVVYQLTCQFPTHFEFNSLFLVTLCQHLYSCRFGTFLFNNVQDRLKAGVRDKTVSVWTYLLASPAAKQGLFTNPFYLAPHQQRACGDAAAGGPTNNVLPASVGFRTVLYPSHALKKVVLWGDYYYRAVMGESLHGGVGAGSVPPYGAVGVLLPSYNGARGNDVDVVMHAAKRKLADEQRALDETERQIAAVRAAIAAQKLQHGQSTTTSPV